MKLTIRLKGGPGSGNHGHRGIPGHQGGSLPKGSYSTNSEGRKNPKEPIIDSSKVTPELRARIRQELKDYAKKFGISANKLKYCEQSENSEFNVGSNKYAVMGEYDPADDTISLYPNSMSSWRDGDHFRVGVISHEVGHSRFTKFWRALEEQETAVKAAVDSAGNNPYLIDGVLKPEYEDKFWAYKIKLDNYGSLEKRAALYDQPVSGYGGDYIKRALKAKHNIEIAEYNAIGENFADITASTEADGLYIKTPQWVKLYNEINEGLYKYNLITVQPKNATTNSR